MSSYLGLLPAVLLICSCAASQASSPVAPSTSTNSAAMTAGEPTSVPAPAPAHASKAEVTAAEPPNWFAGSDTLVYEIPDEWSDRQCEDSLSYSCLELSDNQVTVRIMLRSAANVAPAKQCETVAKAHLADVKRGAFTVSGESATGARVTWRGGGQIGFVACDAMPPPYRHLVRVVDGSWPAAKGQNMVQRVLDMAATVTIK